MNTKLYSRSIISLILLGTCLLASAASSTETVHNRTVYKWTDSQGNVHFTDERPENNSQEIVVEEIVVRDSQDRSLLRRLGLKKSPTAVNPPEQTSVDDQLSEWFSSPEMGLFERQSGWMMTAVFALVIGTNLLYSLCLYLICRKVGVPSAWLAWVPVANFFSLVSAAGYPARYGIVFLLPSLSSIPLFGTNFMVVMILFAVLLFNIVFIFILWIRICRSFWISGWFGLLLLLPPLFFILLAYLAFREDQEEADVSRLKPALATLVLCLALTTAFHVAFREVWMPRWKDKVQNEMSSFMESADSLMSLDPNPPKTR